MEISVLEYINTWNVTSRPPKYMKLEAREELENMYVPLTSQSINNASIDGDAVMLKLLLVADVNVFVRNNVNFYVCL